MASNSCHEDSEMFKCIKATINNDWLDARKKDKYEFMKEMAESDVGRIYLDNKEITINCSRGQFENVCQMLKKIKDGGLKVENKNSTVLNDELVLDENVWNYMEKMYSHEIDEEKSKRGVDLNTFVDSDEIVRIILSPRKLLDDENVQSTQKNIAENLSFMKDYLTTLISLINSSIVSDSLEIKLNDKEFRAIKDHLSNILVDSIIKKDEHGLEIIGPENSVHRIKQRIRQYYQTHLRKQIVFPEGGTRWPPYSTLKETNEGINRNKLKKCRLNNIFDEPRAGKDDEVEENVADDHNNGIDDNNNTGDNQIDDDDSKGSDDNKGDDDADNEGDDNDDNEGDDDDNKGGDDGDDGNDGNDDSNKSNVTDNNYDSEEGGHPPKVAYGEFSFATVGDTEVKPTLTKDERLIKSEYDTYDDDDDFLISGRSFLVKKDDKESYKFSEKINSPNDIRKSNIDKVEQNSGKNKTAQVTRKKMDSVLHKMSNEPPRITANSIRHRPSYTPKSMQQNESYSDEEEERNHQGRRTIPISKRLPDIAKIVDANEVRKNGAEKAGGLIKSKFKSEKLPFDTDED